MITIIRLSYIISYHIISYHIISYHIISYHIISYHIIFLPVHRLALQLWRQSLFCRMGSTAVLQTVSPRSTRSFESFNQTDSCMRLRWFRFEIRDRSSWFNYARNCVCKCSQPSGQFNVAQSATDICVHTCSYVHIHKVECDREISTYTHVEPSCITYSITTIIAAPRHTFRPYSLIYEIFIALNFCLHSCVPRFPSTLVQVDFS